MTRSWVARVIAWGAAVLLVAGCASSTVSPGLARLQGEHEIEVVHHLPHVSFAIITDGTEEARPHTFVGPTVAAALGFIGFGQTIAGGGSDREKAQALGEQTMREYGIEDPVLRVKAHAVEVLARDADIHNVYALPAQAPGEDWKAMKQIVGTRVAIDFETVTWAVFRHNDDPRRYVVAYRARSRLLDLEKNELLWQGECPVPRRVRGARSGLDVKSLPTLAQLLADGAALLKARLDQQADACAEDLMGLLTGRETAR